MTLFFRDDEAVSTVVAAILILAILMTFFSAINAYYIPSLATDNEISHIQDVRDSFAELASRASSGSSNEKIQLPLGSDGLPLSFSPSSSGSLTIDPDYGWINVSMEDVAVPEHEFQDIILKNLTSVSSLYLLSEGSSTSSYTVELNDSNYITATLFNSSHSVWIESKSDEGTVNMNIVIPERQNPNQDFIFDLLNPVFGFSDSLENSDVPFSLELEGSFFVEYDKNPPYETYETGSTYYESINKSTGSFKYSSSNNFWIDQDFVFENGAVILQQSTGNESLIRSKPFITLDEDGFLYIGIFHIVGTADSVSGNGVTTVNLHVEKHEEQVYPSVRETTIRISSDYPDAWQKYLVQFDSQARIDNNGIVVATFDDKSVKISITDVTIVLP